MTEARLYREMARCDRLRLKLHRSAAEQADLAESEGRITQWLAEHETTQDEGS